MAAVAQELVQATSNPTGLSEAEAAARLAADGPNLLPADEVRSWPRMLLDVMREPMLALLLTAAIIYLALGDLGEGIAMLIASTAVITITLFQEGRSERALSRLRDLSSPRAQVLRDGIARTVPGHDLVRGDVIRIGEGDRVPADAVLRVGASVAVDESLLTGEAVPVSKHGDAHGTIAGPPGGDGTPWLFSGTLIVSGRGVAEVLATGPRSELGRIGAALTGVDRERSPLQREVARMVKVMAVLGISLSLLLALIVGIQHGTWVDGLLAGLTLAMSLLPEELPVVLSVFLALGAWRIARNRVLTRKPVAIERLGAIDILCTDKTGTLTQNRMSVNRVWSTAEDEPLAVEGLTELPEAVHELVEYGILACPRDPFDPMEKAFHELGARTLGDTEHLHGDWKSTHEYPLTPELLAVTHLWKAPEHGGLVLATKGAPVAVFALCRLEPDERQRWSERATKLASAGLRVLAVARGDEDVARAPDDPRSLAFHFLGLIGLHDPLREDVPAAVATARGAGIRVTMITGDHAETARAIARQAGIDDSNVLLGSELEALDDAALAERMKSTSVIARAVPAHKLRIIQALRADGLRVAMTGDGVNDAPALKAADVGIAMGARGTDVAREAASLVLVEDDFASIVLAIALGRRIFDNLRRAFSYIVAVHIPIAGLALLPVLLGWDPLLGPIQVVFIELIIDPACSIVFEMEPADPSIMRRPPRRSDEHTLDPRRLLWSGLQGLALMLGVLALVAIYRAEGTGAAEARTMAFLALVIGSFALLIASRSSTEPFWRTLTRKNLALPILFAATIVFLTLLVFVPGIAMHIGFSGNLNAHDLGLACLFGVVPVLALDMLESLVQRRRIRG